MRAQLQAHTQANNPPTTPECLLTIYIIVILRLFLLPTLLLILISPLITINAICLLHLLSLL